MPRLLLPIIIFAAVCLLQKKLFAQANTLPKAKHTFIVVAHRGDHTNAPENTLAAYRDAIKNDADFVEIDLRTTADSQLVIMHDASVDRMTGHKGKVSDWLYDSLRLLTVRDIAHPAWGQHPIPTFKEVLQLCKGKINIYLDFKDAAVDQAYREIVAAGMQKNVVVYINAASQFTSWRNIAPQMPLMISLPNAVTIPAQMAALLDSIKVDILDGNFDEYTPETVTAAKQKRVPIWADIQSKDEGPDKWDKALLLHLDGLQTDHPAALIAYLKKKALR